MVSAPDVDEVRPSPGELVAVVREVVAQVRRRPVRSHHDAVPTVAVVAGAQPGRIIEFERRAGRCQVGEDGGDVTAFVEGPLREPGVKMHTNPSQILTKLAYDIPIAPLACLFLGDAVTQLGAHPDRHLDEVLALVAVLRWLSTLVAGKQ